MMIESALGAVAVVAGGAWWALDAGPPLALTLDQWLCGIAGLVLGQGLIRDLRVVALRRRAKARAGTHQHDAAPAPAPPAPPESERIGPELNVCLESTVGLFLLGLAVFYVAFPVPPRIALPRGAALVAAGVIVLAGWVSRDLVLTLRHIKDHYHVRVWDVPVWRRKG